MRGFDGRSDKETGTEIKWNENYKTVGLLVLLHTGKLDAISKETKVKKYLFPL